MNRLYRLIWNASKHCWQVASERARGHVSQGGSTVTTEVVTEGSNLFSIHPLKTLSTLCLIALAGMSSAAYAAPTGGTITTGNANISQTSNTTTIHQNSQNVTINWNTFSSAANEAIVFNQPNSSAIALNRITGSEASSLLGSLTANGQVFIINPNGILFGAGSQVNVGGLVASTLNLSDSDFNSGNYTFANVTGNNQGNITNQGNISTTTGGYVALLGKQISNQGSIVTPEGTSLLAAGDNISLNLNNGSLLSYSVNQGTLNALAENKQLIQANGGTVILTAQAANDIATATVNNTGVIEAQSLTNKNGTILLLADMQTGTVNVGGRLDASAPNGGNGGFIETSASNVVIQSGAAVTAGDGGVWLIDPTNITIDATAASTIAGALNTGTNVTQTTSSGGTDAGDITVASAITWTGTGALILNADHDININAAISGSNGGLTLNAANAISATAAVNVKNFNLDNGNWNQLASSLPSFYANNFRINGGSFLRALSGAGTSANPYLLTDDYGLQGMDTYLSSSFALANNIDASGTASWNGGEGFDPIFSIGTSSYNYFTGTFDGRNYTIDGLNVVRSNGNFQGLFGLTKGAAISNVSLTNAYVVGASYVGALLGLGFDTYLSNISTSGAVYAPNSIYNSGTGGVAGSLGRGYGTTTDFTVSNVNSSAYVSGAYSVGGVFGALGGAVANNVTATGNVNGSGDDTGGLMGTLMLSTLTNSYATGAVSGNDKAGGLIGWSQSSTISDTYATGATSGRHWLGGLVGEFESSTLTNSYVSGNVSGAAYVGGLAGKVVSGSLANVWASGAVTSTYIAGGLVGENIGGSISTAHTTGNVSGSVSVGGLVGTNAGAISLSYATGAVNCASQYCGGLAGSNQESGSITSAYATGNVTGGIYAGGLVGFNSSVITKSYATGNVTGNQASGGLVGNNYLGSIDTSFATGRVTGLYAGGLVGENKAIISNSYATGSVRASGATNTSVGGLVGFNVGIWGTPSAISNSYASGAVSETTSGSGWMGGLLGFDGDDTIRDSYWNAGTTGQSAAVGATYASVINEEPVAAPANNVIGLTTAQMHTQSSFTTLDFNNKWFMYAGYTAPLLRDFMTHLTINMNDASKTYDGTSYGGGNGLMAGTYNTSLLLGALNLSYIGSAQGAKNAGSYTIGGSGLYSSQLGYIIDDYVDGTLTINKANITLSASDVTKTYDGITAATGSAIVTSGMLYDSLSGGTFSYSDKNAGTAKTVTVSAVTVNDGNSGNNYNVTYADNSTSTINKASLTLNATADSKTYDGNTNSSGTVNNSGLQTGDSLTAVNQAYDNKHAGTGKTISVAAYTLNDGNSGNNYNVVTNTAAGTINQANLTLSTSDVSKTYDGTTTATGNAIATSGTLFTGDSLSGGTYAYTDKNAGTSKTVTLNGVVINDGNSGNNYNVTYDNNTGSTINQANLTLNATADSKAYDGTTNSSGAVSSSGLQAGDSLTAVSQAYNNKNAGSVKTLSVVAGYTVNDGNSGNNYNVVTNTAAGTINKANLTLSTSDVSKAYDGTTAATGSATVTTGTIFTGDSLSGGTYAYTEKNAGTSKTVTVNGVVINDGNSGNNYNVTYANNTNSTISQANLIITANNDSRLYDGHIYDGGNGLCYTGFVTGDSHLDLMGDLSYGGTSQGAKNIGSYTITSSGYTSGNYMITYDNGTLLITPSTVQVATLGGNTLVNAYDGVLQSGIGAHFGEQLVLPEGATGTLNQQVALNTLNPAQSGATQVITEQIIGLGCVVQLPADAPAISCSTSM
ncbi:MAG: YDG domain-containing protein [Methylotenera sp.]|nr:YDG domain-containing protein [Methylotenera sp.]